MSSYWKLCYKWSSSKTLGKASEPQRHFTGCGAIHCNISYLKTCQAAVLRYWLSSEIPGRSSQPYTWTLSSYGIVCFFVFFAMRSLPQHTCLVKFRGRESCVLRAVIFANHQHRWSRCDRYSLVTKPDSATSELRTSLIRFRDVHVFSWPVLHAAANQTARRKI